MIYDSRNNVSDYRVSSIKDLTTRIVPHFEKYPLISQKWADFILFKQIIDLINQKEHLKPEGLQKIVNLRASMNSGLSNELKLAFPNTVSVPRPLVKSIVVPDPH